MELESFEEIEVVLNYLIVIDMLSLSTTTQLTAAVKSTSYDSLHLRTLWNRHLLQKDYRELSRLFKDTIKDVSATLTKEDLE